MANRGNNYASLADEMLELSVKEAKIKDRREAVRQLILDTGMAAIEGANAFVTVKSSSRSSLDLDEVRKLLTPAQVMACTRVSETRSVRVVPRTKGSAAKGASKTWLE